MRGRRTFPASVLLEQFSTRECERSSNHLPRRIAQNIHVLSRTVLQRLAVAVNRITLRTQFRDEEPGTRLAHIQTRRDLSGREVQSSRQDVNETGLLIRSCSSHIMYHLSQCRR